MDTSSPSISSSGGRSPGQSSSSGGVSSSFPRGPRFTEPADPGTLTAGVPIIAIRYRDAGHFLHSVDPAAGPAGELSVRTRASHDRGAEVVLEVRWPELPNRVYLRARRARTRWTGRRCFRLLAGERPKMDFLLAIARGDSVPARRVHHRYCVRLPVQWRPFGGGELQNGVIEDLSAGGVRIARVTTPVKTGELVVVRLTTAATGQDLILTGVVRHCQIIDGETVMGVMFQHRSSGEQRDLRRLIHVFSARGVLLIEAP